jgi:hypothetical protein
VRVSRATFPDVAPRWRAWSQRALAVALALSLLAHLAVSLWNPDLPAAPDEKPLTATLDTLPPPPPPAPAAAATATPRPAAKPRPRPAPAAPQSASAVAVVVPDAVSEPASDSATPPGESAGAAGTTTPAPVPDETIAAPSIDAIPAKTLPPRIDLAYKVFFGTRGFQIGEATYRFEHAAYRYRISTVGQAQGLAALLMRGQGRMESSGVITPTGLQPLEFRVDRFNGRGLERAQFDWETGTVTLAGERTEGLDIPTYDPLTLMWQYYFTPPDTDRLSIAVATTRRIAHFTLTREGRETLPWRDGTIETERWARVSEDGKTEAHAWLAPDLRHLPVKMRITNTSRGTLEAVLDAIRVDETGATVGRDDVPLRPSPPAETHDRASHEAMPGYSPPGATFPSMTP